MAKKGRKAGGGTGLGQFVEHPAKHMFADPEEVADRRHTGDSPHQQDVAPHFSQIAPAKTRKSLVDPELTHHSGDIKFAPGFLDRG